jgi:Na+/proline symporter
MDGSIYDSESGLYHSYNPNAVTLLDVIDKRFRQWVAFIETLVALPLRQ